MCFGKHIVYMTGMVCLTLLLVTGCEEKDTSRTVVAREGKKITLLKTSPPAEEESTKSADDFIIEKIARFDGIRGEDWLEGDELLIMKENTAIEPVRAFDSMENIKNLYTYNVKTGEEKLLYNEKEYLWMPILSPDKKHILVQNFRSGVNRGLILDLKGNTVLTISEENTKKGLYLSYNNAKWVGNDLIIVPTSEEGVCLVNLNSEIEILEGIDLMQTDTAILADGRIYYISTDRSLIAYDMKAEKKEIIKENVFNFELSPQSDKFAIEEKLSDTGSSLIIIDLKGREIQTLAKGKSVFGMSWSPDESKLAYLLSSDTESEKGLYIMNLKTLKSTYVSSDFMGIDNGVKWNTSGTKLLAGISEVKDMKLLDNSYIITLN